MLLHLDILGGRQLKKKTPSICIPEIMLEITFEAPLRP